jgi:hypothetical protein
VRGVGSHFSIASISALYLDSARHALVDTHNESWKHHIVIFKYSILLTCNPKRANAIDARALQSKTYIPLVAILSRSVDDCRISAFLIQTKRITTNSPPQKRGNMMIKSQQAFSKTKETSTSTLQQTFSSVALETIAILQVQAPTIIEVQLGLCKQQVPACPIDLGQQKCIYLLSDIPCLDISSKKP